MRGSPSGPFSTGLRLGPLHQAMAIEGLRTDLEWLSTLVARLDQETPHPVTAWLDVELERLRAGWARPSGRDPDPRDVAAAPAASGCRRSSWSAASSASWRGLPRLERRRLWAERFQLSRLQTQVEALDDR